MSLPTLPPRGDANYRSCTRSTCETVGRLGRAPMTVVATAPAAQPRRTASNKLAPAARDAAGPAERVARRRRVHRLDGVGGDAHRASAGLGHECPVLAQRHHDGAAALGQ